MVMSCQLRLGLSPCMRLNVTSLKRYAGLHSIPLQVSLREATYGQEISRGCLSKEDRYLLCGDKREQGTFKVQCCYEEHCNGVEKEGRRIELLNLGASKLINQLNLGAKLYCT